MADQEKKKEKQESIADLADDLAALQEETQKSDGDKKPVGGLLANKMTLLLVALGGLVLILSLALIVIVVMGTGDSTEQPAQQPTEQIEQPAQPEAESHSAVAEPLEAQSYSGGPLIPELSEEELAALEAEFTGGSSGNDRGAQMNKIMEELAEIELDSAELAAAMGEEMEVYDPAEKVRRDSIRIVEWIEAQEAEIAQRKAELDVLEKELDRRERSVDQKITRLEQVESSRTGNLARLYDGMDARAVANLMANLDDETVLSILPRMNTKNASAVLTLLPPRRAAKLSKELITITED